jgi:ribonucleoside-diphosphate reductase alpha chain
MRQAMPERRHSWTQKVRIDGQAVYMTVGEYADGRPGEIFIDVSKQGTFLRGVMEALARTVSIALQCGADVSVIVHALKGLDYPPNGRVEGSSAVDTCSSVTDWVASELKSVYMDPLEEILLQEEAGVVEEKPRKVCGHIPEPWRSGV